MQVTEAQGFEERQSRYGRAAVYRYADSDEITIQVNVWGAIQNPGIYEMPEDARLNLLFSAAGGPSIGIREQVDEQTIVVKLIRQTQDGQRKVVYEQTMEEEISVAEENPPLQDGDVLTVNSYVVQGVNWRDLIGIGSSLASLVLTIVNLVTN